MNRQYHVLNGDSLKEQFPEEIEGELIIVRECFVTGNVKGKNLDELFVSRAKFLSRNYGGTELEYYQKVVPEFQKIKSMKDDSDINLRFEDDLFCQVNFWFTAYLITKTFRKDTIYLIRPQLHNQYGFGALGRAELVSIYKNRLVLKRLDEVAVLWEAYQSNDMKKLVNGARELESTYPFIIPAVEAHIDRIPSNEHPGRPYQSLVAIMNELETEEFEPIFREFNRREFIYGYGDLQVKRLLDEIIKDR